MHFKGNEEAPAEPAPGEAGQENNSAGSCQPSAEMKGEYLQSMPSGFVSSMIWIQRFHKAFTNLLSVTQALKH